MIALYDGIVGCWDVSCLWLNVPLSIHGRLGVGFWVEGKKRVLISSTWPGGFILSLIA